MCDVWMSIGDDTEDDAKQKFLPVLNQQSVKFGAVSISRTLYNSLAIHYRARSPSDLDEYKKNIKRKPSEDESAYMKSKDLLDTWSGLHFPSEFVELWRKNKEKADLHLWGLNNYIMYVPHVLWLWLWLWLWPWPWGVRTCQYIMI